MESYQNILHHRQIREETNILVGAGNSESDDPVRGQADEGAAIEGDFSSFNRIETRDAVEEGCLSGASGTDNAVNALLLNVDVQLVEGDQPAESFCNLPRLKKGHECFPLGQKKVVIPV